ncbi:MAG: glycosyltransferase [Symploca sp. SIO3C6]|uniref:Glycosyltransferase n=1 Tax=Symploca sp. SIO1C4 TaxID=2607765 RepID=A0A6B3N6Y1_9CYAN|nr:glycosyltransferase [Symploca sp. SIO3C6]NER27357.1 glycosyltransferase [Symploca sp. SIO1C4]NET04304.1 glycosyltransferase [Symploca sp. SIO2B6]
MKKHFVYFTRDILPRAEAHLVHDVNMANAAANLGYSSVLVYLSKTEESRNPVDWFYPFRPKQPQPELINFYNIQDKLKVNSLPMPWPIGKINSKLTTPSTIICRYYFPVHIFPHTKILHTLDWNLIKTAVKHQIPVIYEREHFQKTPYEKEIVESPFFQVAVTVADNVRDDMIKRGMPPEKIVKLHSGFNQSFAVRQPEKAAQWREQLLSAGRKQLVVYSGGLYKFKGVDLLIEVARELPEVQFVFAGGNESQVEAYRQQARQQQANNVTFLGYIKHEQLPALLQAADILAHPHCSGEAASFTSPLKLFEYMASGTPIVATEIPPLAEFRSSGAIAGWCEPDNPTQFTQCLQQVLTTHPRKVEGYTDNLEFASQFSWENRMAKIFSCVKEEMRPQLLESK